MSSSSDGLADFDRLPDSAFVDFHVLSRVVGLGRTAVYRYIAQGRLPAPVKFTPGSSRWRVGPLREALRVLEGAEAA